MAQNLEPGFVTLKLVTQVAQKKGGPEGPPVMNGMNRDRVINLSGFSLAISLVLSGFAG